VSDELRRSWLLTEQHLRDARELLPLLVREEDLVALTQFDEFLEHNEYGLACEVLNDLANGTECGEQFWQKLSLAAETMGLSAERRK
jgi:hypothetical protein